MPQAATPRFKFPWTSRDNAQAGNDRYIENFVNEILGAIVPIGLPLPWPTKILPNSGLFVWSDGVAISRIQYPRLFNTIIPDMGAVSITSASPGVITCVAHGLAIGDSVYFTGSVPTGITANTLYYVMTVPTASTFTLGTTRSVTAVTTAVNTSSTGTPILRACPHGLGDGAATFNTPNMLGKSISGLDAFGAGTDAGNLTWLNAVGLSGGTQTHTLTSAEMPAHSHTQDAHAHAAFYNEGFFEQRSGAGSGAFVAGDYQVTTNSTANATATNQNTGGGGAHNTMQPTILLPWVIRAL